MIDVRYDVWDNVSDLPVVVGGTSTQCASAMGIKMSSFYSIASRCRNGQERKWHVETKKEYPDAIKNVCKDCGATYMGSSHTMFCPECRRKRWSKTIKTWKAKK